MAILFTGDIHLNANKLDSYRHVFMAETLPALVRKHDVDMLVILGDLTTEKDYHGAWLVNRLVGYLKELSVLCPVIINRGNHDYTDPENPFFGFLSALDRVIWVNKPLRGDRILYLPHTINWERDWAGLDFSQCRLICAHQTFEGARVGPRQFEGIPLDIFPENARIISGDIHVPQSFDIVTYAGAPYLCNFGDDYLPRVLLWDGEPRTKFKSIPVPGQQKRLLELTSIGELDGCLRMVSKGDICKVRIALHAKDHVQWPNIQERVRRWGTENGLQIYAVQPKVIGQKGVATARRRTDARTDQQLVRLYGEANAVGAQTLKIGLELTEKA